MTYLLHVLVFLVGYFAVRACGGFRNSALHLSLSLPAGYAILGITLLLQLMMSLPFTSFSLWATLAGLGVMLFFLQRKVNSSVKGLVVAIPVLLLFTLLIDLTRFVVLTHDSQTMLVLGRSLAFSGVLNEEFVRQSSSIGPLAMVLMGLSDFVGTDVIESLTPLNLLAMYLSLFFVGREFLSEKNSYALALGLGVLALAPQPVKFLFYVHSNPLGAVFFSLSLAVLLLFSKQRDYRQLKLFVLFLLGYTLVRFEGPIFFAATLFFGFLLAEDRQRSRLMSYSIPACLIAGAWSLYVAVYKGDGIEGFSNSHQILILVVSCLVPLLYPVYLKIVGKNRVLAHYAMPTVVFIGVNTMLAILKPGFILGGAYYVATVLFDPRLWGVFWFFAVAIAAWLFSRPDKKLLLFAHFSVTYFLIVLAFGYFRKITYQPFWTDSAVRMSFHLAPFLALLMIIYLLNIYRGESEPATT